MRMWLKSVWGVIALLVLVALGGCGTAAIEQGITANTDRYLLIRRAEVEGGKGPLNLVTPVSGSGEGVGVYQGPKGAPTGTCISYVYQSGNETLQVTTKDCL